MRLLAAVAALAPLLSTQAHAKPISCGELIAQLNTYESERRRYPSLDVFIKTCERDATGEFDTSLMEKTPQELTEYWAQKECSEYPLLCKAKKLFEDAPEQAAKRELPAGLSGVKVEERYYHCKNYPSFDAAYPKMKTAVEDLERKFSDPKFQKESTLTSCADPLVALMTLGVANGEDEGLVLDLNYCVQKHCKVDGGWKFIFSRTWTGGESPQCKQFYDLSRRYFDHRKRHIAAPLRAKSLALCRCKLDTIPPFCARFR